MVLGRRRRDRNHDLLGNNFRRLRHWDLNWNLLLDDDRRRCRSNHSLFNYNRVGLDVNRHFSLLDNYGRLRLNLTPNVIVEGSHRDSWFVHLAREHVHDN